ncbi:MAG: metalloregulator ArsR/SmtB family transcription factor, partial [Sporichthyaceae bacterium]|nr:metalloregulator ArsR/SmtB family transcription factor [Sporichthyaceae bacterium]
MPTLRGASVVVKKGRLDGQCQAPYYAASILNHMVNHQPALDRTFAALADPVRRAVLERLRNGEATVSELAHPHPISLPAFLKHVGVLRRAGLVSDRKVGRERRCRLAAQPLEAAGNWITQYRRFWGRQLDSLERYLTE